ncbi:MAG: hypothetical protein ACKOQ8_04120 [Micrococcales bacterium]
MTNSPRRIRVAFLVFYFEAWDSLAELHRRLLADDRFEVLTVAIPRRLTGDVVFDDASGASEFLTEAGVAHEVWAFADEHEAGRRLREWAPDYTFLNYPWQRNYQRGLRPDALIEFTRIAYVPYFSLSLVLEPGADGQFVDGVAAHYFTQRTHQLTSLIFVQSEEVREAFGSTSRGTEGVVVVGAPKLDALVAEVAAGAGSVAGVGPTAAGTRRRITWAPHHSYSPHWLNFGTFAEVRDAMLELAQQHSEVEFVLRAHPFMFGTLVDRGVIAADELDAWRAAWGVLPNTVDGTDYSLATVFDCDLLVSDGISFLAEYPLATGRSGLFIEREGHWPFSRLGELAARANHCTNIAIFVDRLTEFLNGGEFVALNDEIAELRAAAMPFAGQSAALMHGALIEHWATEPGLVDPTQITETAWELLPGREPLD